MNPYKKIAIISGASGYVGKAVAKLLHEKGFNLALISRHGISEDYLVPKESYKGYSCDLSSQEEVAKMFDEIKKDFGGTDLVVHAAGLKPERKKLLLTSIDSFNAQMEQNVLASFNFLTAGGKFLQSSGGGVLAGITTIGVTRSESAKSLGAYIPAKYAVQGMLSMLKDELAPSVRVYSLAPGFMDGGMNSSIPKAFIEIIKSKSKDHKLATGEDIANSIVELYENTSLHINDLTIEIAPEYE